MIGEALTTRRKSTLDLRLEFLDADLDRIHARTGQGHDETSSIQPGSLRTFSLRDLTTVVPVDRGCEAQFASKFLGGGRGRHNFRRQLDCNRRHCECPLEL